MPARKQPADHKTKTTTQRLEAEDTPTEFDWDGEVWVVVPSDATKLEFLAALEDEEIIGALRLLFGKEQAARLIKGRKVEDLERFFTAMGEAVGTGNP